MAVNGSQILAEALKRHGVDTFFYIMGAPMMLTENACIGLGMRAIDVRHEQAAAMMAHAYARLRNRPGVCMAASGPATTNLWGHDKARRFHTAKWAVAAFIQRHRLSNS